MDNGQLPVGFLDRRFVGGFVDPEDGVVVFALGFLELEFGGAQVAREAAVGGGGLEQGFEFFDGGFPLGGFREGAGEGAACFVVGRVEGEGAVAVGDGGGVVFELDGGC